MGYIFDALNKQKGEKPGEQTASSVAEDTLAVDRSDDKVAATFADALAGAQSASDEPAAPLRLADLHMGAAGASSIDNHREAVAAADDRSGVDTANVADTDVAESGQPSVELDLTIDRPMQLAKTKQKASLWQRLLGGHLRGKVDDRLVAMTSPASATSEEYRSIRTSILARHDNERHLVHTITSATPQEGKTITCVNLGLSFAELRNRKTIIIECDLRLPTFGKLLSCDTQSAGLIDFLRGEASVSDIIQQVEGSQLHIIPAGGRVSDEAVQLLSSQRMSQLIQGLRAKYDHVIIDTPPVLQLADAGILGSQSEEVLVVARMRRTPRPLVEQAISTLTSYNAQVNGIIATDNPRSRGRGYGYKYGYRYGYAYGYTTDRSSRKQRKRDAA
jgi:capsular exopolysaccharide synthesis family protein